MSDIIHLLPDSVANQIAAGEVIQRPASAVKELLENAIDAGADQIEVYAKESGKQLIQVIDNGSGMSTTDARMSFERHATSKIRAAQDLFSIRTMGFRGEALASIAAVAQVELKTRRHDDELGTRLIIEGSAVQEQEPASVPVGTSFSIKNLFFNIPARRNFLKSNPVESRHIMDEFERVALAHPSIQFSLQLNGVEQFRLQPGNLRQRIVGLYGTNYNERLVPLGEDTSLIRLSGFIGKPEFAKKSRGEQFLFVNQRYVRDNYLNHAIVNAFEGLLPRDSFPSYWIFIDIDPARIDVNIHPTKTEIKFDDERSVYAIVRAAVKRSLGQYAVSPSLDFERETAFDIPLSDQFKPVSKPGITVNTGFNPFTKPSGKINASGWEKLYDGIHETTTILAGQSGVSQSEIPIDTSDAVTPPALDCFQLANSTIVCNFGGTGILMIDQQSAHERIIYERLMKRREGQPGVQHKLFPVTMEFTTQDFSLMKELLPDLNGIGFELTEFGMNTFVLNGAPENIEHGTERSVLEQLMEHFRHAKDLQGVDLGLKLIRSAARSMSIKSGRTLALAEMQKLVSDLLECDEPSSGIDGKPCSWILTNQDILSHMRR